LCHADERFFQAEAVAKNNIINRRLDETTPYYRQKSALSTILVSICAKNAQKRQNLALY